MKSPLAKSLVVKRSIAISGHLTSISLEPPFFEALKAIATERGTTLQDLVTSIDAERRGGNLPRDNQSERRATIRMRMAPGVG